MVTISLDSSLDPLFKRGYRKEVTEAPLNEVLAAGMLMISGWNSNQSLTDPMCGSGTLPIEAGMMACKIPPGKFRKDFGFMRWKNFDQSIFETVVNNYDSLITGDPGVDINGSDISRTAINSAIMNAGNAGLEEVIHFREADFRNFEPDGSSGGYLFFNPPYGERISKGETDELYGMIGSVLKHKCHGHTAWIISSNKESVKYIGLKPSAKYTLYNGALECLFAGYELYEGSRKAARQ
jgi:putative N6-adenine-specific DNA methylase